MRYTRYSTANDVMKEFLIYGAELTGVSAYLIFLYTHPVHVLQVVPLQEFPRHLQFSHILFNPGLLSSSKISMDVHFWRLSETMPILNVFPM